jgi:sRNA-binding carbon storage regulator CsrA
MTGKNRETTRLMLNLEPNECLHIGDDVTLKIVRFGTKKVRVMIVSPRDKHITRDFSQPIIEPN